MLFSMAPWAARSSARACSSVAPGASRPNSSVMRWTRPVTIVADRWCGLVTMLAMISVSAGYGTEGSNTPTMVALRAPNDPSRTTLPMHRWVALQRGGPEAIGQNHGAGGGRAVVRISSSRPSTGRRPITSKYVPPTTPARTSRGSPRPFSVKPMVEKSPNALKRFHAMPQILDLRHGEHGVLRAQARRALPDVDQAIFVAIHQGPQQNSADQA